VLSQSGPAPGPRRHAPPGPAQASLTISPATPLTSIPRSFLGLSTEYWTLPVDERHVALYKRVLTLLHVPGDGRFVLRIGGDSSDHTFFDPRIRNPPRWAFELTHGFVTRTARIVRQLDLRVILDMNLVTGTPALAGAWARDAEAQMPRGSIFGFEVGNEPDLYDRAFWLYATSGERFGLGTFASAVLPPDITPLTYVRDYDAYARTLSRIAPHVPLLAPALANPYADVRWIAALLSSPHPGLGEVSGHRYPYSGCALPGSPQYPTIERILSEKATAGMARTIEPAVALARRAGLPFRLTEFNSITCGGLRGVSNTFSTALWAPDAAFELERAGARGINLHARVFSINDPFTFDLRGLRARPLLYGLILFARTLGPNARLVHAPLHADPSLHMKAWSVRVGRDTLHVLLINKGRRAVTATLNVPARAPATVTRLLAPSPAARRDVTLGGQRLDQDGNWVGVPQHETLSPSAGGYSVTIPRFSAALVSVRTAAGPPR
jgi:hypothetical protein